MPYKCDKCGKKFETKKEAEKHEKGCNTIKKEHLTIKSIKDKWVTLVLALLLGWLGVHRFYVGKVGTGTIYLFTSGLFFIGVIMDIILILTDSFTDKSGAFLK